MDSQVTLGLYMLWCRECSETKPHYLETKAGNNGCKVSIDGIIYIGVTATFICLDCGGSDGCVS